MGATATRRARGSGTRAAGSAAGARRGEGVERRDRRCTDGARREAARAGAGRQRLVCRFGPTSGLQKSLPPVVVYNLLPDPPVRPPP